MRGRLLLMKVAARVVAGAARGAWPSVVTGAQRGAAVLAVAWYSARDGAWRGARREVEALASELDVIADHLEDLSTRYARRRG